MSFLIPFINSKPSNTWLGYVAISEKIRIKIDRDWNNFKNEELKAISFLILIVLYKLNYQETVEIDVIEKNLLNKYLLSEIPNNFFELLNTQLKKETEFTQKSSILLSSQEINEHYKDCYELIFSYDSKSEYLSLFLREDLFENLDVQFAFSSFLDYVYQLYLGVKRNIHEPIENLSIFNQDHLNKVLQLSTGPKSDFSSNASIYHLFIQNLEKNSDKIAIYDEEKRITFLELDKNIKLKCKYLAKKLKNDSAPVGLLFDRCIDAIEWIYALAFLGIPYLPLDPQYPAERLNLYIELSKPKLLITQLKYLNYVSEKKNQSLEYCISDQVDLKKYAELSEIYFDLKHLPKKDLYILFTSGSTGTPKKIIRTQSQVICNLKRLWVNANGEETICQLTSYCFAPSVNQIFGTLLFGKSIVIVNDEALTLPEKFIHLVKKYKVKRIWAVPSLVELIIEYTVRQKKTLPKTLEVLSTFGEGISIDLVSQIRFQNPHIRIRHSYGLAETLGLTSGEVLKKDSFVHIGKPQSNVKLFILDRNEKIQPAGFKGQIVVSTPCLIKDASNVVCLPGFNEPFLKTGDLGAYTTSGNVVHLGREDFQIKIAGKRVNLLEVKAKIEEQKNVKRAVVLYIPVKSQSLSEIIAFVIPKNNCSSTEESNFIASLHVQLENILPPFMLPSCYKLLSSFPKLPNGKISFLALKQNAKDVILPFKKKFRPPSKLIELELCQLMAQVLKISEKEIGLEDSFFSLGGSSLNLFKLKLDLEDKYSLTIPNEILFQKLTLDSLARFVEKERVLGKSSVYKLTPHEGNKHPISPNQNRLLIQQVTQRKNEGYNLQAVLSVKKNLKKDFLYQTVFELCKKHRVLSTCLILSDDNEYFQIHSEPNLESCDCQIDSFSQDELLAKGRQVALSQIHATFDPISSFPIKFKFLLAPNQTLIVITCNHLFIDGQSLQIIKKDFCKLYDEIRKNLNNKISLGQQHTYFDYCHWVKSPIATQLFEKQLNFWTNYLKGTDSEINFNNLQKGKPGVFHFDLEKITYDSILKYSERKGLTPFIFFYSIFSLIVGSLFGKNDFVIGFPIAGRHFKGLDEAVGFFALTSMLRVVINSAQTFDDYTKELLQNFIKVLDNQDLPFERIVDAMRVPRVMGKNPLFQTLFNVIELGNEDLYLNDVKVNEVYVENENSNFDLFVTLFINPNKHVSVRIQFSENINCDFIQSIAGLFDSLSIKLIQASHVCLKDSLYLLTKENEKAYQKLNDTFVHSNRKKNLYSLFLNQCELFPERNAFKSAAEELTYINAKEKVDKIAIFLSNAGIKKGDRVIIVAERSINTCLSIIALFKIGASYTPLHLDHIHLALKKRIAAIDAKGVLYDVEIGSDFEPLFVDLPFFSIKKILDKDSSGKIKNDLCQDLNLEAYVLFTSGSTGEPKGIKVSHDSIINLLEDIKEKLNVDEKSSFLGVTDLTFDISVLEMWLPLVTGGTYILVPKQIHINPRLFVDYVVKTEPKIVQATPTFWSLVSDYFIKKKVKIPILLSGGELLKNKLGQRLLQISDFVWNVYGPTETTIWSTFNRLTQEENTSIIGTPFANTQVFVINSNRHVLPPEVPGELVISGKGLSNGYLDDSLNKKHFEKVLFGNSEYLVYKTGDQVVLSKEGSLKYISRIDNQVKINGKRIELEEIEHAICSIEEIKEAVVIIHRKTSELTAYVSVIAPIDETQLKSHLKKRLPVYMIPSSYFIVESFPVLSSGKINRRGLEQITTRKLGESKKVDTQIDQTDIEEVVRESWEKLLKISDFDSEENFFDLGGNSIKLIKLSEVLKEKLNKEIDVIELFNYGTLSQMTEYVAQL